MPATITRVTLLWLRWTGWISPVTALMDKLPVLDPPHGGERKSRLERPLCRGPALCYTLFQGTVIPNHLKGEMGDSPTGLSCLFRLQTSSCQKTGPLTRFGRPHNECWGKPYKPTTAEVVKLRVGACARSLAVTGQAMTNGLEVFIETGLYGA
jgi:hypothetical protein